MAVIPLHNRVNFFKYMKASTALKVLETDCLQWSSPLLFNDPFDVPRELPSGVTSHEVVKAIARHLELLIRSPLADTSELEPSIRYIVEAAKGGLPERVTSTIIEGAHQVARAQDPSSDEMNEFRQKWRELIPRLRVLCLTESPAHSAMWYHYADKYTGAVLEFACRSEIDSTWRAAEPVNYPTSVPAIFHADDWAALMMMPREAATKKIVRLATYTKSPDWSYEKEWRITAFAQPGDTELSSCYKFEANELAAVYLGPR